LTGRSALSTAAHFAVSVKPQIFKTSRESLGFAARLIVKGRAFINKSLTAPNSCQSRETLSLGAG